MPATLGPLRFEPFLRPMVWGGHALGTRLGKTLPTPEPYGESWEVSDHVAHRSVVAEGPWQGWTLRQLMEQHREALLGPAASRFETFPWLCKFLDARDWLSVQVHPDAVAVKTLWPGEGSKTEAWYVIDALPTSRIYAGLKPGVGPQEMRNAMAAGTVADCLHSFVPEPGDCVFLPAGTVHAVGGGVLMAEIQETSDATFRLFDWHRGSSNGKPRPLHQDEALAAIHWEYGPVQPVRVPVGWDLRSIKLVTCAQFSLKFQQADDLAPVGAMHKMQILIVLAGSGRWRLAGEAGWRTGPAVAAGQVWLVPANQPFSVIDLDAPLRALLATLP